MKCRLIQAKRTTVFITMEALMVTQFADTTSSEIERMAEKRPLSVNARSARCLMYGLTATTNARNA